MKALFEAYHAQLCQVSYRIVQDPEEAKDVVQEVFIKLWKNRQALQLHTSLLAYLRRAVVNTSLNWLEKQKRFTPNALEKAEAQLPLTNQVEQGHTAGELAQLAEQAIQQLPPRTKAIFTLIRHEEMSYKEVAKALEISTKAVEKEMMKALRLLREALKEYLPVWVLIASEVLFDILYNFFKGEGGGVYACGCHTQNNQRNNHASAHLSYPCFHANCPLSNAFL